MIPSETENLFIAIEKYARNIARLKVPAQDLDDVTQDICLHVWKSFDTFQGKSALMTWVKCIAHNRIVEWYRKQERTVKYQTAFEGHYNNQRYVTTQPASRWDDMNMDHAVDGLISTQRHVIMESLKGKTLADIATEDHAGYEKTRSQYRRAVDKLRVSVQA